MSKCVNEKIYCSQCHNSVYRSGTKLHLGHPFYGCTCFLYCYKKGRCYPADKRIDGCKHLDPESLEKLLSGKWEANVAASHKRR